MNAARQLSDYLHSLPLASFPIGPISCYPSSPGHRHLLLDLPPRPKPRRRAGESCAGRQAVRAPARVAWSPPRVADCPSWHPSRSMSLMSREPMVELPAAVWCDSTRWRILRQFLFGGYEKPRIPGVAARSTGLSAVAPVPVSPCPADRSGRNSLVTCDKKEVLNQVANEFGSVCARSISHRNEQFARLQRSLHLSFSV